MDKHLLAGLKVVRYKIIFVKRGNECAFPEQEVLVTEDLDATAFVAWKMAEFLESLVPHGNLPVPEKWTDYPPHYVKDGRPLYRRGDTLLGFLEEDKKYPRVYYEVVDRYPRENLE